LIEKRKNLAWKMTVDKGLQDNDKILEGLCEIVGWKYYYLWENVNNVTSVFLLSLL